MTTLKGDQEEQHNSSGKQEWIQWLHDASHHRGGVSPIRSSAPLFCHNKIGSSQLKKRERLTLGLAIRSMREKVQTKSVKRGSWVTNRNEPTKCKLSDEISSLVLQSEESRASLSRRQVRESSSRLKDMLDLAKLDEQSPTGFQGKDLKKMAKVNPRRSNCLVRGERSPSYERGTFDAQNPLLRGLSKELGIARIAGHEVDHKNKNSRSQKFSRLHKILQETKQVQEESDDDQIIVFDLTERDRLQYLAKDSVEDSSSQDGRDTHGSSTEFHTSVNTSEKSDSQASLTSSSFDQEAHDTPLEKRQSRKAKRAKRRDYLNGKSKMCDYYQSLERRSPRSDSWSSALSAPIVDEDDVEVYVRTKKDHSYELPDTLIEVSISTLEEQEAEANVEVVTTTPQHSNLVIQLHSCKRVEQEKRSDSNLVNALLMSANQRNLARIQEVTAEQEQSLSTTFLDKPTLIKTPSQGSFASKDSQVSKVDERLDLAMLADDLTTGSSSRQARMEKRTAGMQKYNKGAVAEPSRCEPKPTIGSLLLSKLESVAPCHFLFDEQDKQSDLSELRDRVDIVGSPLFGELDSEMRDSDTSSLLRQGLAHRDTPQFHPPIPGACE